MTLVRIRLVPVSGAEGQTKDDRPRFRRRLGQSGRHGVSGRRRNGRSGVRPAIQGVWSPFQQLQRVAHRPILTLELGLPHPHVAEALPEHRDDTGEHQQRSKHVREWYRTLWNCRATAAVSA